MPPEADVTLDAGVTACGDLVLLIARQMRDLSKGQVLHVIAYDRGAAEDIPAWCRMTHSLLLYQMIPQDAAQVSHFYIQKD
jgi:TusA-related sulfurtransferase